MISSNSTQTTCANKSFNVTFKHLLNAYKVESPEDTQMCQSHLRKLIIYLEKRNHKIVVLEGT